MISKFYEAINCRLFKLKPFRQGDPVSKVPDCNWGSEPAATEADVARYLAEGRGVGAALPDSILVVDVDTPSPAKPNKVGGQSWELLNMSHAMQPTVTVASENGGRHYYYRIPAGTKIKKKLNDFPDIDFLSKGCFVVAAGSPHWLGGTYEMTGTHIAEAPASLVDELKVDLMPRPAVAQGNDLLSDLELQVILEKLPVTHYASNDAWFRIMAACHHATDGRGLGAFLTWSLADPQYQGDYAKIVKRWDSLYHSPPAVPLTVATLYSELAKHEGPRAPAWQSAADDFGIVRSIDKSGRPMIDLTQPAADVARQVAQGLASSGDVYVFKGALCQVVRFDSRPVVRPLTASSLLYKMADCCTFYKETKKGKQPADPTERIAMMVKDTAELWQDAGINVLNQIVTGPQLLPDGSILGERGFHARANLLIDWPPGEDYPQLPDDVDAVADELINLVVDFPFLNDSHKAAWLAMLLTVVCRSSFKGSAPCFFVDGNDRGVGKSLLVEILSRISNGQAVTSAPWPDSNEEMTKVLTGLCIQPVQLQFFDNVGNQKSFGHAALDSVITTGRFKGRVLGKSNTVDAELMTTFVATGNRLSLNKGSDIERRLCVIRLDCPMENPEDRKHFVHGNEAQLIAKVEANWQRYYMGCLAIVRRAILTGWQNDLMPWGSFSAWGLIRSAVIQCGLPDPGKTRDYVRSHLDDKKDDRKILFETLIQIGAVAESGARTARDLHLDLSATVHMEAFDIVDAQAGKGGSEVSRFGRGLSTFLGQVSIGYKLKKRLKRGAKCFYLDSVV